MCVS
jgi:FtsZ-binding cell division protein ZapB